MKTAIQAAVLYALARHASDKTATAWPSVSTICAETLYSESGVRAALSGLVASGVLVRTERKAPNGRSTSSCYRIAAGEIEAPVAEGDGPGGGHCTDVTVQVVEGEGPGGGPYEGPGGGPSFLNRSDVNRPNEPNEVCVDPKVVDRAREPEPTHTHKPETYLEAFAKRMREMQARQAEELAQYLAENPEPPPPPPAHPPAPYWGGDRRAADDGWGPVQEAKPEPSKHELAGLPELEELVNASKPAKLRRLSLGDVEARALLELVEKHGAEAVRAALLGLAGEYERPLQPVRKHLEAAAAAPAIPRHPNGQPMWVVERDGYKRMLSPSGAPW